MKPIVSDSEWMSASNNAAIQYQNNHQKELQEPMFWKCHKVTVFHSSGCQTTNDRQTVTLNIELTLHKVYGYLNITPSGFNYKIIYMYRVYNCFILLFTHSQIHTDGNRKNSEVSEWTKVTSTKLKVTEWHEHYYVYFLSSLKCSFFPVSRIYCEWR